MTPIVISFYTNDWKYREYAEKLKEDCARLGLESHIVEVASTGSYVQNCNIKPRFIRERLEEFKRPVFWMDVDGSLVGFPPQLSVIHREYDLALNWASASKKRWSVGSMYFSYTRACRSFVAEWGDNATSWVDHVAFDRTIPRHPSLRIFEMPQEWVLFSASPGLIDSFSGFFVHRVSRSDLKAKFKQSRQK